MLDVRKHMCCLQCLLLSCSATTPMKRGLSNDVADNLCRAIQRMRLEEPPQEFQEPEDLMEEDDPPQANSEHEDHLGEDHVNPGEEEQGLYWEDAWWVWDGGLQLWWTWSNRMYWTSEGGGQYGYW